MGSRGGWFIGVAALLGVTSAIPGLEGDGSAKSVRQASELGATVQAPAAAPITVTLVAVADAYIDNGLPNNNYGASEDLFASLYGDFNNVQWTLARFDLSSIPAAATIQSATVRLYQEFGSGLASVTLNLNRAGASWTEYGVTFNNRPTLYLVSSASVGTGAGWKSWDATSLVSAWVGETHPNYGVGVSGPVSGSVWLRRFSSR